jgi:biopolymer transport protein ExbB
LLGLLGTVAGLVGVFSTSEGIPSPEVISKGVGLALSTTILGLTIAIPAIIGSSFLNRKIDKLAARINVCVERLLNIKK